ncbi:PREDICTED: dynamin-related protein 4C-like [Tarenaya hassleriana]|nr:PREDICTED: dynamin-related protein 4C-like [Tarenaya hassleriana]
MGIIGSVKESLVKILVQGDFSEYLDDRNMHCTARLADMLSQFSGDLQKHYPNNSSSDNGFLMDEIKVLEECKSVGLPNFLPRSAFLAIFIKHIEGIQSRPVDFMRETWEYIDGILSSVISKHSDSFPQIQQSIRRAGRNLICKMKERSVNRVIEMVETEKQTDYTCNPEYISSWNKNIAQQGSFIKSVKDGRDACDLPEFGTVKISHLRVHGDLLQQAFDLKMRITAYWTIVLLRIVDNVALHLRFSVINLVDKEMEKDIVAEMVGTDGNGEILRMLVESPAVASKREKLKNSIKLLKESKDVLAAIVDQNSV